MASASRWARGDDAIRFGQAAVTDSRATPHRLQASCAPPNARRRDVSVTGERHDQRDHAGGIAYTRHRAMRTRSTSRERDRSPASGTTSTSSGAGLNPPRRYTGVVRHGDVELVSKLSSSTVVIRGARHRFSRHRPHHVTAVRLQSSLRATGLPSPTAEKAVVDE